MTFLKLLRSTLAIGAVAVAAGAGGLSAGAQLTGQNKPVGDENQAQTIKVTTRLIIENVGVKDKKGVPIGGLTAKDFTITEDGVAQKISICEHQVLPEDATPMGPAPAGAEQIKIYNKLATSQIAGESAGQIKYKDHRLMALYFDMTAMPDPVDQMRALEAAQKFIRTQMTEADLVAIMRYQGSSVDVLQDFSDDRNRLLSILETMVVGEGQQGAEAADDASSSDTGAAFGQDDSEFNIFTTDRQLAALQTAAETLGRLNEKKELIIFASGLNLNGLDNQAQMVATEQAAIRAGVSFWPIDSRGLVAQGPLGDATQGSPGGSAMYTGSSANALTTRFAKSQDTLYALAGDTGGKALLDNNDLDKGIVDAQHAESDYYILGYYTSNTTKDGKFRKVKVTVNSELSANLDFRQGYFGEKEWGKFNTADKERQLEDALMQGDPWTDLTIATEVNYFQLNKAEYFVPVMMKVPGREIALAKKGGADHTHLDLVGEIKDDYGGTTVANIRDHFDAKLGDTTAAEWAKRPIEFSSGYTLLPGKYTIKVLARDDETGRIGTFQTTFVIPNLNKETKQVPISSVVLSSERKSYSEAIYNVAKEKDQVKQAAVNPLVQNGQQMIPSVTRVFSKARSLSVFLQAYEGATPAPTAGQTPAAGPAAPTVKPLIAFVSFYQGQNKVYETQPEEVSPTPNTRLQIAPLNFTVDLSKLAPGKYDCQVTVLDPMGAKGAFWQAPILLVP
ncbi:MAG TPA: VWA domain-containing protein [Acidobacteriaceae bacterium]|jgi:VWFA-related protein|nr:VWA domain-containing protein [Acidobacteriaceae bacterium]